MCSVEKEKPSYLIKLSREQCSCQGKFESQTLKSAFFSDNSIYVYPYFIAIISSNYSCFGDFRKKAKMYFWRTDNNFLVSFMQHYVGSSPKWFSQYYGVNFFLINITFFFFLFKDIRLNTTKTKFLYQKMYQFSHALNMIKCYLLKLYIFFLWSDIGVIQILFVY